MPALANLTRPTEAVAHVNRQIELSIESLLKQPSETEDDILQGHAEFRSAIGLALQAGLTAHEIALNERVAKSTISRWASGDSVPQLIRSRSHIARSVLTLALSRLNAPETKSDKNNSTRSPKRRTSKSASPGQADSGHSAGRMRA